MHDVYPLNPFWQIWFCFGLRAIDWLISVVASVIRQIFTGSDGFIVHNTCDSGFFVRIISAGVACTLAHKQARVCFMLYSMWAPRVAEVQYQRASPSLILAAW